MRPAPADRGGSPWTIQGRNVLITGASSGVGLATARALAARGANLWLLCRDAQRGEAALDLCRATPGAGRLELLLADLSSQEEIRAVAAEFLARNEPLHVLVNNAAAVFFERTQTVDEIESTLAVNHVAPFLLTHLLRPRLLESAPARVITVASAGHRTGRIRLDDLGCQSHAYQGLVQYSHTKLANVLFTRELARRLEGTGVVAHSLHPGVIRTGLGMNNTGWLRVAWNAVRPLFSSPEKGADTVVFLVCDAGVQETNGAYWARRKSKRPGARGRDDEMAARLWKASEALARIPDSTG
ncbi:MAG: SDR family NAD(P)-dependent oxidoreductase [Myxococcota bacterium]|nr:SDR family NAD(P)-dependent oxidoreductase [Myxococcota bacterium]